ncbi:hypothetical protein GCM10010329_62610 [Streptomyces spiroverticillatus]|nr:hypothetical protein GCM10010329_62610 [Streptomyces spiroverticillatus]
MARCEGRRSEARRLGLEPGDLIVGDWTAAAGYEAAQEIVRRGTDTAVYVASDSVALGVLRGLADAGLRVPDDVSVIGHNDEPNAACFAPPLTTIHEDLDALAELLMATVGRRLAGETSFDVPLVQPQLVVRKSTTARRG